MELKFKNKKCVYTVQRRRYIEYYTVFIGISIEKIIRKSVKTINTSRLGLVD